MEKVKEYLKVSDLIDGPVRVGFSDGRGDSVTYKAKIGSELCVNYHRLIEHAINSHDELVNQRNELLSVLKSMMHDDGLVLLMRHDQIERNRDAITKAKGGAA